LGSRQPARADGFALTHRLEGIEEEIAELEEAHGMTWSKFQTAWGEGGIEDARSFEARPA